MSQTSSATPGQSPWPPSNVPSSSASHRPLQLPTRYPGDGLDFRRPVTSNHEEVIDLTEEPDSPPQPRPQRHQQSQNRHHHHTRLPRFGRNIMEDVVDLVEDDDEHRDEDEDEVQEVGQGMAPSSPEVEFVGATTRAPAAPARSEGHLWRMLQGNSLASFVMSSEAFRRPIPWASGLFGRQPHDVDSLFIGGTSGGLDIEYPVSTANADRRPQVDTYKAPSPAPEGFTRNAKENDEVVVCPNCDQELGTGDETKSQIWVVKKCGHVYCGECTKHRALSKAKKAPQRTKPFSKCRADDCGVPVSAPKSMFQVYL
jgi:ribosomal protein L37AE/L43A